MSIRSQDDYELFHHIEISWQSIKETVQELERRGYLLTLEAHGIQIIDNTVDPVEFKWRMTRQDHSSTVEPAAHNGSDEGSNPSGPTIPDRSAS